VPRLHHFPSLRAHYRPESAARLPGPDTYAVHGLQCPCHALATPLSWGIGRRRPRLPIVENSSVHDNGSSAFTTMTITDPAKFCSMGIRSKSVVSDLVSLLFRALRPYTAVTCVLGARRLHRRVAGADMGRHRPCGKVLPPTRLEPRRRGRRHGPAENLRNPVDNSFPDHEHRGMGPT
jgi:hypothetical protein